MSKDGLETIIAHLGEAAAVFYAWREPEYQSMKRAIAILRESPAATRLVGSPEEKSCADSFAGCSDTSQSGTTTGQATADAVNEAAAGHASATTPTDSTKEPKDRGWLKRQLDRTAEDVKQLPSWLRQQAAEVAPGDRLAGLCEDCGDVGLVLVCGRCGSQHVHQAEAGDGRAADELTRQRVIGHGEGQEHAIADVNAGRVDDLIEPRLRAERAKIEAGDGRAARLQALIDGWTARAKELRERDEPSSANHYFRNGEVWTLSQCIMELELALTLGEGQ